MRKIKSEIVDGKEVQTWEIRGDIIGALEDLGEMFAQDKAQKYSTASQQNAAPRRPEERG